MKCTKNYNARAQLLFCSSNLLFGDVLVAVAVAVVFCVRSLFNILGERDELKCYKPVSGRFSPLLLKLF